MKQHLQMLSAAAAIGNGTLSVNNIVDSVCILIKFSPDIAKASALYDHIIGFIVGLNFYRVCI